MPCVWYPDTTAHGDDGDDTVAVCDDCEPHYAARQFVSACSRVDVPRCQFASDGHGARRGG